MSDENMNNSNEETAALFVSSQKKKAAEEAARRKAEEEQARREAAEAEVRRMEQEVEERKRKAEEEARALEEAEKQLKEDKARQADTPKPQVKEEAKKNKPAAAGKSKLPLYIGIGAAALVVVLIAVFALGGKKKVAIDYSALEFDKEYEVKTEGYEYKIKYPGSIYTNVTEEDKGQGVLEVVFGSEEGRVPETSFSISNINNSKSLGFTPADKRVNILSPFEGSKPADAEVIEESKTDLDNPETQRFFYSFLCKNETTYAFTSWLSPDSSGSFRVVGLMCSEEGGNPDDIKKLRDMFDEKNSDGALLIPGSNPPKSTDTDGMIEIDAMHMGIIVPKDLFKKNEVESDVYGLWTDDNGAAIIVAYGETPYTFDDIKMAVDAFYDDIRNAAKKGPNTYLNIITSRNYLDETVDYNDKMAYLADYRDMIGGIQYCEQYYSSMWRDVRTQKYYYYKIILLAPEKNEDVYKEIFKKSLDRLQDI